MTASHSSGEGSELTGSIRQVDPVPTAGERAAHRRLHAAAIALVAAKRGSVFPTKGQDREEFIAAAGKIFPELVVVKPGGAWPADLLQRVAVLVADDGSVMLLMTQMLRRGAFPGSSSDDSADLNEVLPETELLTVHQDGESYLGAGEATSQLLALVPTRKTRDQS